MALTKRFAAHWVRWGGGKPLALAALAWLSFGCGGGIERNLGLQATVDGDRVIIDWDGRPVHDLSVMGIVSGALDQTWWVSMADFSPPPRDTEPAIVPPIEYGQPLGYPNVSTALPLERGAVYDVYLTVFGWDTTCEEHGQEYPDGCTIAAEDVEFTY
jgi:hypothetical protein